MKTYTSIIRTFVFSGLLLSLLFSCKKFYDKQPSIIGPSIKEEYTLLEPFTVSTSEADFTKGHVFFKAKFDKAINWKIIIKGEKSFATKTLTGYGSSIDSTNSRWDGSQDILYYFRSAERCVAMLSYNGKSESGNIVFNTLNDRGEINSVSQEFFSDSLIIKQKKNLPSNQYAIFPSYNLPTENNKTPYWFAYHVGYDLETYQIGKQTERSLPVVDFYNGKGGKYIPLAFNDTLSHLHLDYAEGGQAIVGNRYFMLKGQDRNEENGSHPFYIGRAEAIYYPPYLKSNPNRTLLPKSLDFIQALGTDPNQIWLNVFVYGTDDGSSFSLVIKEKEDAGSIYFTNGDDAYSKQVPLNFKGWKLISYRYSDFTFDPTQIEGNQLYGNRTKEPNRLYSIQFSLGASKQGANGFAIFDYPIISIGQPLQY